MLSLWKKVFALVGSKIFVLFKNGIFPTSERKRIKEKSVFVPERTKFNFCALSPDWTSRWPNTQTQTAVPRCAFLLSPVLLRVPCLGPPRSVCYFPLAADVWHSSFLNANSWYFPMQTSGIPHFPLVQMSGIRSHFSVQMSGIPLLFLTQMSGIPFLFSIEMSGSPFKFRTNSGRTERRTGPAE